MYVRRQTSPSTYLVRTLDSSDALRFGARTRGGPSSVRLRNTTARLTGRVRISVPMGRALRPNPRKPTSAMNLRLTKALFKIRTLDWLPSLIQPRFATWSSAIYSGIYFPFLESSADAGLSQKSPGKSQALVFAATPTRTAFLGNARRTARPPTTITAEMK